MTTSKRYQPGTGDALDSTPDLKERQRLAATPELQTGAMLDILDTDHHEIGTKDVPDLPMPDPRASRQTYPARGRQPKSDDFKFADILTVPCGPPKTADNHDRNPDRRQYASTQASSYSTSDPRNFFLIRGGTSLEITSNTRWQSGPSSNGMASDHAQEQAGYWTSPGAEGMNWRNWGPPAHVTYEPACAQSLMKNEQLTMLYNFGHGTATSSPEGMDHAVIGASGWFQSMTFGIDVTSNYRAADNDKNLPDVEKWIDLSTTGSPTTQIVGMSKAAHVYNMYRSDLTDQEMQDLINIGDDVEGLQAAGLFDALCSDNPFKILTDKKLSKKLLTVIPSKKNAAYADALRMLAKVIADVYKIRTPDITSMLRGLEQGKLQWMEVILWAWSVMGEQAPGVADPETGMVTYASNNNNHGGSGDGSGSHKPIGPNHPPFNHVQEVFDYIHSKNYPDCKGPPCQHYLGDDFGPMDGVHDDGDTATWIRYMWEVWHKKEHPTCDGTWAANGKGKWCIHQPGGNYHEGWTGWDDLPDNMQEVWWKKLHNDKNLPEHCPGTWERNLHRFPESDGYCPHHPKYPGVKKPIITLGEDYEWIKDSQVLGWLPEDPSDPNKGGHLVIQTHQGATINITRDKDGNYLVNGKPPTDEDKVKWDDFWSGLGEQVHVGDGPNGAVQDGVADIVNKMIQNLNDWKDKVDNLEQKVNLITGIYNIITSKGGEIGEIMNAIWEVCKAVFNIYSRFGSKHKTIDYIVELTERQAGDEGGGVIVPRPWDTTKDDRWSSNWFAHTHTPRFFNRTVNYSSQAIIQLYRLRFNGYLIDKTMLYQKDEFNPGIFADTHNLNMLNWAPTFAPANFSGEQDYPYFNRIPAEYPDPARRHEGHEDWYESNPRAATSIVPMRRRPTAAAQEEWGDICEWNLSIFRPDMCWVMRGKKQKSYPNMAGKMFRIGTQEKGKNEVWRISGPTTNRDGVGYYMRNLYTELGFGMQCDVNYNSDDTSHQVVMDVMTARPTPMKGCLKHGKLRVYMNVEAHNLNGNTGNTKEHHKFQLCDIHANFINRNNPNDRKSIVLQQHPLMEYGNNPSLGYTFRRCNTIGTDWDTTHHVLSQIGTDDGNNIESCINEDNARFNANGIRKALLLSCDTPGNQYDLLGFTFILWPGNSSPAGLKWHCFTIKRMRFLKSNEDFIEDYWNTGDPDASYDDIPFEHRRLFFNYQRVAASEDDWVYNDQQTELINELGKGLPGYTGPDDTE